MSEESLRKLATSLKGYYDVISDPFDMRHCHPCYAESGLTVALGDQKKRQAKVMVELDSDHESTVTYQRRIAFSERTMSIEDPRHPINNFSLRDLPKRFFANQVEIPEWLVDIPPDFDKSWYAKPCPDGKRVLLVAHQGRTKVFSLSGEHIASFNSVLPGGGRSTPRGFTTLSCVWSEDDDTYYVLDLISWNDSLLYSCETEFRFYWLRTKIDENPEIECETRDNEYAIVAVPVATCDKESLTELMACFPLFCGERGPDLHGIQFYHKRSRHGFGKTSLVTWLLPFMMKDILGIEIHPDYLAEKQRHFDLAAYARELEQATRARIASLRTELFMQRRAAQPKSLQDTSKSSSGPLPAEGVVQRRAQLPVGRTHEYFQLVSSTGKTSEETETDTDEAWQLCCYSAACMECTFFKRCVQLQIKQTEHNSEEDCNVAQSPITEDTLQGQITEEKSATPSEQIKTDFPVDDPNQKSRPKTHDIG